MLPKDNVLNQQEDRQECKNIVFFRFFSGGVGGWDETYKKELYTYTVLINFV